jgi:acyl-coenzyme A synthetase/AMP-(fatty) acid ligase
VGGRPRRPGTIGRVVPGFDVKVCDADGSELPDGEVGALWVGGESRAIGYWQDVDTFVTSRHEPYKYPREVVFIERLPRTHLG